MHYTARLSIDHFLLESFDQLFWGYISINILMMFQVFPDCWKSHDSSKEAEKLISE